VKPAIFISHSAKDPDSTRLLDELKTELERRGFEVLLDYARLQTGQKWRDEIHTWMSACHGAVILFTENAYNDSDWVLKEATILSWRVALDRDFKQRLIPVLFEPVEGPWLSEGRYEPLALGETQAIAHGEANIVARIADAFMPLFQEWPSTPLDEVLAEIATILRAVSEQRLRTVAAKLAKPIAWNPASGDTADIFAREILHVDLERVKDVLLELQPSLGASSALRILDFVSPYCIDPVAATPVARVALTEPGTPPRDAVALNANDARIADLHVQRARKRLKRWAIVRVTADGSGGDLEGALRQQIQAALLIESGVSNEPELLSGELAAAREDGDPYFVLIKSFVPPHILQRLRLAYPDCTLMVLTGESSTEPYDDTSSGVTVLRPLLAAGLEQKLVRLLVRARNIAANRNAPASGT
jgi:hypothetical protein